MDAIEDLIVDLCVQIPTPRCWDQYAEGGLCLHKFVT